MKSNRNQTTLATPETEGCEAPAVRANMSFGVSHGTCERTGAPAFQMNADRYRHTAIIGRTGSGKSNHVQQMEREDIRNGAGVLILAAHADDAFGLPEDSTVYGVPEVRLRMATPHVRMDGMVASASLVDTIDGETPFKAFLTKARLRDTLPVRTAYETETGGGLSRTRVREFVQSNAASKLVTFGYADLRNPGGGYDGADYTPREEEMAADEYHDHAIFLQPTAYTFGPAHKAVLVITGWDPCRCLLDEDYEAGLVGDETQSRYAYSFDIDNATLELRLPKAPAGQGRDV